MLSIRQSYEVTLAPNFGTFCIVMSGRAIGDRIIELASVDSTNKYAAKHLDKGELDHGTVILAHEQTNGVGQRGREWASVSGKDLTCSIILKPRILLVHQQFDMSKLVALAIRDALLANSVKNVAIKWPNDLLVDDKKIAGILIQNDIQGDHIMSSIVGIGVNVGTTAGEIPIEYQATSMFIQSGKEHEPKMLLEQICTAMNHRWNAWMGGSSDWKAELTKSLWARGRWADMLLDGAETSARPLDVDGEGRLVVEMEGGEVRAYGLDRLRFNRT